MSKSIKKTNNKNPIGNRAITLDDLLIQNRESFASHFFDKENESPYVPIVDFLKHKDVKVRKKIKGKMSAGTAGRAWTEIYKKIAYENYEGAELGNVIHKGGNDLLRFHTGFLHRYWDIAFIRMAKRELLYPKTKKEKTDEDIE